MADSLEPMNQTLQDKLREHCESGYRYYDQGDYKTAIRRFYTAWTLIPKPQTQWQEAGWVLTALGDAYFRKQDFKNSLEALSSALHCPGCSGNPFVHLRLGQTYFELDQKELAIDQFQHVLDHQGRPLFEHEDNKYLNSLLSHSNA